MDVHTVITFVHFMFQENTTTSSVIGAVQNLGQVVMESANSPVDQTRANLNTTAVILDSIANYVQTQRGSNFARDIVRCLFTNFTIKTCSCPYAHADCKRISANC